MDLLTWSRAAHELVAPYGVLAGYSAAELHGASCALRDASAEVLLLDGYRRRSGPNLVVRRDALTRREIMTIDGLRVTTPARTAADLARWARNLTEAVVAVDALCHVCGLDPAVVVHAAPGTRGVARLAQVVELAEPLSESPMETRIRLALVLAGLPRPTAQHPVQVDRRTFFLDLAYPDARLGIEYNGAEHLAPERALRDLEREQLLVTARWRILRFDARTTLRHPRSIATRVRAELADQRALVRPRS